ncbi:hypothetical protein F5Y15DRAFT_25128 [Xylariaceae sp. FL0016]|nr:hypothetical protein F5Y15DRAFT_25128 [Xylariaceae sp. FL0016]
MFTLERSSKTVLENTQIIPKDEIKMLCFGVVPTIFQKREMDDGLLRYPLDDSSDLTALQLGSWDEMAKTSEAMGCNTNTANYVLQEDKKLAHLFPVSSEMLGIFGRTIHASGSTFRMLPNPTMYR